MGDSFDIYLANHYIVLNEDGTPIGDTISDFVDSSIIRFLNLTKEKWTSPIARYEESVRLKKTNRVVLLTDVLIRPEKELDDEHK